VAFQVINGSAVPAPFNLAHAAPLRLARPEVVHGARQSWLASLGNSLLEAPWAAWSLFDMLVIATGVYLGYSYFVWAPHGEWVKLSCFRTCCIGSPAIVMAGMVFGLYEQQTLLRGSRILVRSLLSTACAITATYLAIYLFMYSIQSRGVLLMAGAWYLATAGTLRLLVGLSVHSYSRRYLIVGTDRKSLITPPGHGDGLSSRYQLAGYITLEPVEVGRSIQNHRVLGAIDDIERVCLEQEINEVVVGTGPSKNPKVLEQTLACLRLGCRVTNLSTFYEQVLSEVPIAHLEPTWFLFADLKHYREAQLMMKRACDVVGALIGFILSLPLWPLIALLIRLDSPGPAFYSQERVGLNGRLFRLYKFRTMHVEAERNGQVWAAEHDPRITRIGWYLRRARLDELPQLWNILLGHMSIVGPRPERPVFVDQLAKQIRFYNERHLVKPGLTGWAQVNYRYGASVDDARRKLQLDLWYIKHMSLELDTVIFLRTLGTVFLGSR
jgi:sugar transferase (PEP-CTERM system associated)